MARVTVEDCIEIIDNRFELVSVASHRTRQIISGNPVLVEATDDKFPVVALREIADKKLDAEELKSEFKSSFQKYGKVDVAEDGEAINERSNEIQRELQELTVTDADGADSGMQIKEGEEEQQSSAGGMNFGEEDVKADD